MIGSRVPGSTELRRCRTTPGNPTEAGLDTLLAGIGEHLEADADPEQRAPFAVDELRPAGRSGLRHGSG